MHAAPVQVQSADGDMNVAVARLCERRERAAFLRGERAGRAEALTNAVARLDGVSAELTRVREVLTAGLVRDSVELSLTIAAELVRSEVQLRRHNIETIVRETLMASGVGRGACTVHVSPVDAEVLARVSFRSGTKIESDPDVQPGCVQVETDQGLLVRDIDGALASIAARLREEAHS